MIERITLESLITKPENCHPPKEKYKDSEEALYEKESGDENDDVEVTDRQLPGGELFTFVWNRGKSNSNITDTGKGKFGFSFYYARYAYRDPYLWEIPELASDKQNTAFLGRIIDTPKNDDDFGAPIMLVIQAKKESLVTNTRKRIVSAYFKEDDIFTRKYYNRALHISNKSTNRKSVTFEGEDPDQLWKAWQWYKKRALAWEEAHKLL